MFCTNCGKKLTDDTKFCPYCGKYVQKISGSEYGVYNSYPGLVEQKPDEKRAGSLGKRKIAAIWIIAGVLIISFILVGILAAVTRKTEQEVSEVPQEGYTEELYGEHIYIPGKNELTVDAGSNLEFYNDILMVFVDSSAVNSDFESIAASVDGEVVGSVSGCLNVIQIRVAESSLNDLYLLAETIKQQPYVEDVCIDIPLNIELTAEGNFTDTWNATNDKPEKDRGNEEDPAGNDWWAEAIGAYTAWNAIESVNLNPIKVGVFDSGIDAEHPELQTEEGTSKVTVIGQNTPGGHGTAVTGFIAAENNNTGIRGIADTADIIGIDWDCHSTDAIVMYACFNQFISNGCSVINCSFARVLSSEKEWKKNGENDSTYENYVDSFSAGSEESGKQMIRMIDYLLNTGNEHILFVQGAGNGYDDKGPAYDTQYSGYFCAVDEDLYNEVNQQCNLSHSYEEIKDHIIITGGIGQEKTSDGYWNLESSFCYGNNIDIAAPGYYKDPSPFFPSFFHNGMFTLWYDSNKSSVLYSNDGSGTSFAAPQVSGSAALLWQIDPTLTAAEVKDLLLNTGETAVSTAKNDTRPSYPMLNVGISVKNLILREQQTAIPDSDEQSNIAQDTTGPDITELYNETLDSLKQEYGIFENYQYGHMSAEHTDWLNPSGVLSSLIMDFDSDGSEEMMVCISEKCDEMTELYGQDCYHILVQIYECENNQVTLADSVVFGPDYDTGISECIHYPAFGENETIVFNAVTVSTGIYLTAEYSDAGAFAGADGSSGFWIMEYTDKQLRYIGTAVTSYESMFFGYEYDGGKCTSYEQLSYPETETVDFLERFSELFGKCGIEVRKNYIEPGKDQTALTENNEKTLIFEFVTQMQSSAEASFEEGYDFAAVLIREGEYWGIDAYQTESSSETADLAAVYRAYADYLESNELIYNFEVGQYEKEELIGTNKLVYSLVYIDGDDIPELVFGPTLPFHSDSAGILKYTDGQVILVGYFGEYAGFGYYERENIIVSNFTGTGESEDGYYRIEEDGSVTTLCSSVFTYDGEEFIFSAGYVDGTEVTEDQYNQSLNELLPDSNFIYWSSEDNMNNYTVINADSINKLRAEDIQENN